jgi:hypothetical protein
MRKKILPMLTLFFLAPILAELVSGSAPPALWFSPGTYLVMVPLYGAGALLARELAIRWKSGWLGMVVLGAAYGILEEGIDVMSFFNTAWPDLGASAFYGRWAEVSWVWTVHLICYHTAFSIAVPILLVHLIFPKVRGESWFGCFGFFLVGAILGAAVFFGNLFFRSEYHYTPPPLPYLAAFAAVFALGLLARRIRPPAPDPRREEKPLPMPLLYALAGFGGTVAFFYTGWALPETPFPPFLTILILLAIAAGILGILAASYRRGRQFTDNRKLALAFGGLMFFILLSPILEASGGDKATGESFSGMTCVGIITFLSLALLSIIVWQRERHPSRRKLPIPPDGS